MTYVPNELLSRLVGYRLYSVRFVIDLAYLYFDSTVSDDKRIAVTLSHQCFYGADKREG